VQYVFIGDRLIKPTDKNRAAVAVNALYTNAPDGYNTTISLPQPTVAIKKYTQRSGGMEGARVSIHLPAHLVSRQLSQ
jgi:hypothetical protein